MAEPNAIVFHRRTTGNLLLTWFAATRPAFLTASVLPVIVALALSKHLLGGLHIGLAVITLLAIVFIHTGANVLNDYFDARNGTDEANNSRVYPFSGGSRFIQNNVLTIEETRNLGTVLITLGAILGLWITSMAGPWLFLIGLIGGSIAIFYSAPPCLACRGLGDIAIGACFGVLPVIGTAIIHTGAIPAEAWWLGIIIGFFVAAILWANSIPDIDADRHAGKLTLPARVGSEMARFGLPLMFLAGFLLLVIAPLPRTSLLALAAAIPAIMATLALFKDRLIPALPLTIFTHAITCILLAVGLLIA